MEGYANFETLRVQLERIARSPLAKLSTLGRTREGREVFLLTIGKGKVDERPGILVLGGVDATQLVGSELAVRMAKRLVERAADEQDTERLLERVTFYVIPRASPDACEFFFRRPIGERTTNT
ncbi:MAG: M14 family zinc carboxypeptidase, partial [Patescibacteria group bacterium]|nr:M14 family zinc carboxypeptidase [Patescibacteria group bacterium]